MRGRARELFTRLGVIDRRRRRSRTSRFDVAIHAPHATALYAGSRVPTGGAELQTLRLARALAAAGLRVCHVVFDAPGLPSELEGVHVIRQRPPGKTPLHTVTYAVSALMRADSHVYLQRGAGWETGLVGLVARLRGRAFVFSSSANVDFTGSVLGGLRERLLFAAGARLASVAVVQSRDQLRMAQSLRRFRRTTMIRSFGPEVSADSASERRAFLWIGRLDEIKRPMAYVELAEAVPGARFWMLITGHAPGLESLQQSIIGRASSSANLELLEPRPQHELVTLYRQAVALVNTSWSEGFPNVFMEAWATQTPVLSLAVDPDGVIAAHGLGVAAQDSMARLIEAATRLWSQPVDGRFAATARDYMDRFHGQRSLGAEWESLIRGLMRPHS